ncbi:helix-turn-helix domain-containing protein [Sphaerochaeta sp. PS]|uniref:response regulator transcription factor n=1 Tax=Sphaerochaeta sp. PS TaxID=3076336 RepID=UPI0028A4771B|nr:helix-turn-helix domain-containing protein [Sphaerochaeta sp. PS]MDT4761692.1 response regulator [Sphaerochaeta sp. PS]
MTKLIIADDEPLVLIGLQSMLKWADLDIEICSVVRNGQQLEEAIARFKPDLVISDIKMPIKTGLEVLEECRTLYGKLPLFIILTSFEEFSFVKQAIKFQAVDYLVKLELTQQSLLVSVNKALVMIAEIQEAQSKNLFSSERSGMLPFQDKFFVRLFNGLIETPEAFEMQKRDLSLDLSFPAYAVGYCQIEGIQEQLTQEQQVNLYFSTTQMIRETVGRYLTCHTVSLDMHHLAITFCLSKEQEPHYLSIISLALERLVKVIYDYFSVHLFCCVGKLVLDAFDLSNSFFTARQLLATATKAQPVILYDRLKDKREANQAFNLDRYKEQLTRAFEELDGPSLSLVINEIAQALDQQTTTRIQAIDAASNILYMAISLIPDGQLLVEQIFSDEVQGYRSIYKMNTTTQCAVWVRKLGNGLHELLLAQQQDYRAKVIAKVQQFILANLDRKLQLSEVSSVFGFSQNYLSSLFSRYGGCSFVKYTTNAKINMAKEMIASGDYKIYEISEKLGFESSFYFSKVFKKAVGCSPREYMQRQPQKREKR